MVVVTYRRRCAEKTMGAYVGSRCGRQQDADHYIMLHLLPSVGALGFWVFSISEMSC